MRINLAKSAGFCFGVKRAIKIALELASSGNNVEMLGDIVHNETVVEGIKKAGVDKVSRLKCGRNKILLIRAHGACEKTIQKAKTLGYRIVDATCPMVKEIHKIVKAYDKNGYRIVIIGDQKHDEVHGIAGQVDNKAIIISDENKIPLNKLRLNDKLCLVSQSTQTEKKVNKIYSLIKPCVKELKFFNTICAPTRAKQKEIKDMPLKNDVMIVIGSRTSANTKRLYEISWRLNKRTYWVEDPAELQKQWFRHAKNIGVTSGASTPCQTTDQIIKKIKNFNVK